MSKRPLCVAFLWHMHQPDYRKTQTGEIYLPWTRFHAIKDYYDMGALAERGGNVHLTINLVPSLIDQLEAYASGTADEIQSVLTLRDASSLNNEEKAFLLRTFFQLSPAHMLFPYPRYKELLDRRGPIGENTTFASMDSYTVQDYRDLQLWYNLTWCGPELRRDPEIAGLFEKGSGFTEEDKKRLLEIQRSFIGRILPYYRKLSNAGAVEFSISPYYHPILPLLCDLRAARESLPSVALPADSYTFPQDAREQIDRSLQVYEQLFGIRARGMWPSEGALSDASLSLARGAGLRWLASDESVLWNSLHGNAGVTGPLAPERRYSAYRWGGGDSGPCLFFRDHALSDLFGFAYYSWGATDAVADFLTRLRAIHESLPDNGRHYVVPVILDGENAWEHYPENGSIFLELLYRRLSEAGDLKTVTFSEFLDLENHREPLRSVVAGSWIYGNLATWIGHAEKNRAWELLASARRSLSSFQLENPNAPNIGPAFREIMIAEGSDWFWWYGDDHQTENAAEFDALFRSHLKDVYRLLDETPPLSLDEPIKKVRARIRSRNPVHTLTPQIDGRVSDYFEWISAGFAIPGGGDSMHRTERLVDKVFFGYDSQFFYLRIDLAPGMVETFPPSGCIRVHVTSPEKCVLALECTENREWRCRNVHGIYGAQAARFAADRIMELALPLEALGVRKPAEVTFFISVLDNDRELERFPSTGLLSVPTDPWGLDQQEWMV
jgi:alpha-amylase/alpha-mannosidase (GH57 family)